MRLSGSARSLFEGVRSVLHAARLSRRPRTLRLEGLKGKVEILTDTWGVPNIYADHEEDLFFAQGYVTARDRLFQLDYNRHGARGRLCELLGERPLPWQGLTVHLKEKTTFDVDVMLRTFGLERCAQRSTELLSPHARRIVEAYTAGINARLAELPWTLEHRVLGRQAPPWVASDTLVMTKAIAFELNYAWRSILFGGMLARANVPEDIARVFWPQYPEHADTMIDSQQWAAMAADLAATREAASAALGMGNAPGAGSNAWAVAASHSATGGALLANDPHLNFQVPLPWHEVRMVGAGYDLRGFTLAGLPGISMGYNGRCAWGITAGLVHDLDIFVERRPAGARETRRSLLARRAW